MSISLTNIKQRTEDYFRVGIDVLWLLGPESRDERVANYLGQRFGEYYHITSQGEPFDITRAERWAQPPSNLLQDYFRRELWKDLLRLTIVRYLQIYGTGLAPDFRKAIAGAGKVENLFGSNMSQLKKTGAVISQKSNFITNQDYPLNLWKLVSFDKAAKWLRQKHVTLMKPEAIAHIKSRSSHQSVFS